MPEFSEAECAACGRKFRKRRQAQRYCSEFCRKFASDRRRDRQSPDPRFVAKRQKTLHLQRLGKKRRKHPNTFYREASERVEKRNKNNGLQARFRQPRGRGIDASGLPPELQWKVLAAELWNVPAIRLAAPAVPNFSAAAE
jgi:hypothetical protein